MAAKGKVERKNSLSIIFLLLLISEASKANNEAVYEFVKLFEYSDFSSSWPFTFRVSEGVSQAYWYFQATSSSPGSCEEKNVSIHLRHGSLPVINPLGEKFPDNFYVDGSQRRSLHVMTDNLTLSTSLRNPRAGHWYGVAYLPKTENQKILPDELFYECDYKLRSWLTTDLSSDIETVSLGEKVDVVLAAQDSKLYNFFVPVNTKSHSVTISSCAVVNTNTTSCPLVLMGKGQGIPGDKNSTNIVDCSEAAEDDGCQLSDSSPAVNDWTYLILKSETENEMILTLEVKVTEISILPKPVTKEEPQIIPDYQLLPLLDRFSYNSMFKNRFAYAVGGTVKDVVTTLTGSQTVVVPFKLEKGDTGGSLALEVKLKELLSTSMEIDFIVSEFCVLKAKLPFVESRKCQGGFLGNMTSQGQRSQKVVIPYPSPETYFVGLRMKCYESPEKKNQSAIKVPCSTTSAKVSINVTTDACVGGECNSHGKCHNYLNGHVLFSTCKCSAGDAVCVNCLRGKLVQSCRGCSGNAHVDVMNIDGELFSLSRPQEIPGSGWRGYDCSDGQESRQEHEQLLELLLLTLTNVLFIPGIVLALYRRHFVEALVYTFTMTFSGLYHACDGNRTGDFKYCPLRINILSIADFLGSALCIWVTLVAMSRPPKKLKAVLQMAGPLGLLFGVLYKKTSAFLFIAPAGLGLLMIFISWVCRCCYRHKCYPTPRRYLLCLLPGILLAVGGICIFTFLENKENYLYVHSGWHACMALCIVFLLPPRERKGDYKVRQANSINLGSTYQPIRPAEENNYVI